MGWFRDVLHHSGLIIFSSFSFPTEIFESSGILKTFGETSVALTTLVSVCSVLVRQAILKC